MKIAKKVYSFILILAMLVSVFSVSLAFAAEPEENDAGSIVTLTEEAIPYAAAASTQTGKIIGCKTTAPVMKTASAKGASAGKLKLGAKVTIKKANASKGWHQIVFGKGTAYIQTKYVQLATANKSGAPAVKEPTATKTYASVKKVSGIPATIDGSTANKGYVNAKWSYDGNDTLKFMLDKSGQKDVYNFSGNGVPQPYSLNYGNGKYSLWLLKVISGTNNAYPETNAEVEAKISGNDPYLASIAGIEFNSNMAPVKLAAQLVAGKKTDLDKVTAIHAWVVSNIKYDYDMIGKLPAGYQPNIEVIYAQKKGVCFDFASLFAAMCRSQGIPCKMVKGNTKYISGYHAWNEVYISGSWKAIDASYDSCAKQAGANYKMIKPNGDMKKSLQY